MELTKNEEQLIDLLKEKEFDKDDVIGCILSLNTDDNIKTMIDFIVNNENVGRDEIFDKIFEIMGIETLIEDEE